MTLAHLAPVITFAMVVVIGAALRVIVAHPATEGVIAVISGQPVISALSRQ